MRTRIPLFALSFLVTGLTLGAVFVGKSKTVVTYAYTNGDAATYYSGISGNLVGNSLTTALNTLNNNKLQKLISYDSLKNYFTQTDPGARSGEVTAFYSGTSAKYSGNMNREHVWPFSKLYINTGSRGQNDIEKDLHMIRPTMTSENSDRGNSFFTMPSGQGWDPGSLGDETYRGDSARIIFYCCIADLHLTLVDKDYDSKDNHTMGKLSTLLQWNLQYPVSQREKVRNEAAESIQGHRNPFIDHPEYACRIWGNTNLATQAICGSSSQADPNELIDIQLSHTSATLQKGETLQIEVAPVPDTASLPNLIWGSTNTKVATVNNGLVTAIGPGECKINVITEDGKFMVTCLVDVPGGKSNRNNGCGGNIVTTSSILSAISLLGIGLILFRFYKRKE